MHKYTRQSSASRSPHASSRSDIRPIIMCEATKYSYLNHVYFLNGDDIEKFAMCGAQNLIASVYKRVQR